MVGDRHFYDSSGSPGRFTEQQLTEIRNSNLARITCDNGDNIKLMQPLAFRRQAINNPVVPCDAITIPVVNLSPWQERAPVSPYNYHHSQAYSPSPSPPYSAISSLYPRQRLSKLVKPFQLGGSGQVRSGHRFNVNIKYGK